MKIKYDMKVIRAYNQGLRDGILNYLLDLKANDKYTTKKESKAYQIAFKAAHDDSMVAVWKANKHRHCLLEYAINTGIIQPVGWYLYNNGFTVSIEER